MDIKFEIPDEMIGNVIEGDYDTIIVFRRNDISFVRIDCIYTPLVVRGSKSNYRKIYTEPIVRIYDMYELTQYYNDWKADSDPDENETMIDFFEYLILDHSSCYMLYTSGNFTGRYHLPNIYENFKYDNELYVLAEISGLLAKKLVIINE